MPALVHVRLELAREIPRQQARKRRVHRMQRHVQPACMCIGVPVRIALREEAHYLSLLWGEWPIAHAERRHRDDRVVLAREQPQHQQVERRRERGREQASLRQVHGVQVVASRAEVAEPHLVAALELKLGGERLEQRLVRSPRAAAATAAGKGAASKEAP